MDKDRRSIYNAKNSETEMNFGDLQLPVIQRDKLHNQMLLFLKFVGDLPTKSGMSLL
jgi:hypothetical protein